MNVNFDGVLPIRGEIVIVEDEPTLGELAKEILGEIGARCITFTTGDDALVYLLQSHTDCALVIADHGVPGQVQGVELVEMIASKWPSIPAIITSGWTAEIIGCPANVAFLMKPWTLEELVVAVAEALQPGVPVFRRSAG